MKIMAANWTAKFNSLLVKCDCGNLFNHRADRWIVVCSACGNKINMEEIRSEYACEKANTSSERKE